MSDTTSEIKPDRVSFKQVFPTGIQYLPLHIGAEYPVLPGQDPNEVFKIAVEQVRKWNLEYNPSMGMAIEYSGNGSLMPPSTTQVEKTSHQRTIDSMITDMQSVTDPVVLKTYEFLAKKYPEIQAAYELKYNELSNNLV